jgi:hypothetical protein
VSETCCRAEGVVQPWGREFDPRPPRTGNEPEWFCTLKSLSQDLSIASSDDRKELQHHAFGAVGLLRQFFGQGRGLFDLGESGFVKEFRLPPLLPFLGELDRLDVQQQRAMP